MGNTNGTTNVDVIAQEALVQLQAQLPILGQIARDCSETSAKFGSKITINEVQAATAIDFNPTVGYVAADRTMVDIDVTLNKHKHHTYGVGVQEASATHVDLIARYAKNAAYSLGSAIVADICALVIASNFTNKTTKALGAGGDGFNRKTLLSCGTALSKRGALPFDRYMLLNGDYFGSLMSDDTLLNMLVLQGGKVVSGGAVPEVHDFKISQYVDLPENSENLVGFCGIRSSLGFATRLPDDPGEGQPGMRISAVKDEQTGIAIQTREWYDGTLAKFLRTYTLMYGVGKGQVSGLQRIVSA